jgi:hypothetical protein
LNLPLPDESVIWRVEVELPTRRRHPLVTLHRLRRALESDSEVIQVRTQPWLERLVLRSLPTSISVEVAADSPGAAAQKAELAVGRSLGTLGHSSKVRSWIVSTDGERLPAPRAKNVE